MRARRRALGHGARVAGGVFARAGSGGLRVRGAHLGRDAVPGSEAVALEEPAACEGEDGGVEEEELHYAWLVVGYEEGDEGEAVEHEVLHPLRCLAVCEGAFFGAELCA